ncbi:MAG: hypothetical protein Q9165_001023 [Trypethelium subeluteriae]
MQIDQKNLEQKNHELMDAFKEKSKSQQQVQKLYQSLKAQVMASRVAFAASDDAENTINTVGTPRFADRLGVQEHIRETLSAHRTRLPRPLYGNFGSKDAGENDGSRLSGSRGTTRQPLRETQPTVFSHPVGNEYGMTAGLKVGRQTNFPLSQANTHSYRHGGPINVNLR